MKKCTLLFLALINCLQIYAAKEKPLEKYSQKVYECVFADSSKNYWLQKNSDFFRFNFTANGYDLVCADASKQAYIPIKRENKYAAFRLSTTLKFDTDKGYNGSAGIAFGVKGKLGGGYILELDKRRRYRLQRIDADGPTQLTGKEKDNGWVKESAIEKAGKDNKIDIISEGNNIDIFINGEKIFRVKKDKDFYTGSGYFLNGAVKVLIKNYTIYIEKTEDDNVKVTEEEDNKKEDKEKIKTPLEDTSARKIEKQPVKYPEPEIKKEKTKEVKNTEKQVEKNMVIEPQKKDSAVAIKDTVKNKIPVIVPDDNTVIKDKPVEEISNDIATLSSALAESRKKNNQLQSKLDNCQSELLLVKSKQQELQDFINNNLDVKMKKELETQTQKANNLEKENKSLKAENTELRKFKDDMKKNKDGDLIIILSENIKKEKQKSAELEKKIKLLEAQLQQKKK